MELIFFGVGIGMIISIALVGLGVVIGDRNNKGHNSDKRCGSPDNDSQPDDRNRDRRCDNGRNIPHTLEEKVMVLNTFRTGTSWFEKCVLDEISDDLIELDAIKFLQSKTEQKTDMNEEAKREQG